MSRVEQLSAVAEQLDNWIDGRCGETGPLAAVAYAPNGSEMIGIDDVTVWCSESSGYEPTFANCRDEYLRFVLSLSPFWDEAGCLANKELAAELEKQ